MLINRDTGEIFVYGPIGDSFWEEGITDTLFVQALDALGGKRATVRINSPGGVADQGIAIYNILKRYSGGVDTVVDSVAASAASVIALAGERRTTSAGGKWMIHQALMFAVGNSTDMRKAAELLDTYDASIVEIYSAHITSGIDIKASMAEETWFTADAAIEAGLSTGKGEPSTQQPAIANWYRNAPAAVLSSKSPVVVPKFAVHRQAAEIKNRSSQLQFVK